MLFESSPESEGIKTSLLVSLLKLLSLKVALNRKGLRPGHSTLAILAFLFESSPESEGIKTGHAELPAAALYV